MGFKKAAALIFLRDNDKFLLLKRNKPPFIGMWVPIGGKINAYESPDEAAIRETKEETGIDIASLHYLGIVTETSTSDFNWISYIYLADVDYIPPPYCNEGVLEWKYENQLDDTIVPMIDLLIFEYIRQAKKFNFNAKYDVNGRLYFLEDKLEETILIS